MCQPQSYTASCIALSPIINPCQRKHIPVSHTTTPLSSRKSFLRVLPAFPKPVIFREPARSVSLSAPALSPAHNRAESFPPQIPPPPPRQTLPPASSGILDETLLHSRHSSFLSDTA